MARRTPGQLSTQSSVASLPLRSAVEQQQQPAPTFAPSYKAPSVEPQTKATGTRDFVLADMDGRSTRDNRACTKCIRKLAPSEVQQINWHLTEDQPCRLCAIAEGKPEAYTKPFTDFLRENPTVFHTVDHFKTKLSKLGFTELPSRDSWADQLQPGGKYYTTRNGSSIIAFTVGKAYKPGDGVAMVAGHIDAITARLKPVSTKPNKAGYVQLGVAPYAGGLNQTWWDRDLSIGGRVVIQDEQTGKTESRLVKLDWPIAKIPTLAPHFGVGIMGNNNPETEAVPIIGLEGANDEAEAAGLGSPGSFVRTQPPRLVKLLAKELGVTSLDSILNWELELFDSQPAGTLGLDREFITAGRIDDKLCSWSALTALLAASDNDDEGYVKLVALFDDEEIGSLLRQGARGNFLPITIERIVESLSPSTYGPGVLGQTYARSFLASADVTHAGHPNFLGRYLDDHVPRLNVGMVLSTSPNGHMTTDAVSTAIMRRVGHLSGSETQVFQVRNDSREGGTVGPMLSSAMGVRAADVGLPQISMHSIRATTGALDPGLGVKFFKGFFDHWQRIDGEWA